MMRLSIEFPSYPSRNPFLTSVLGRHLCVESSGNFASEVQQRYKYADRAGGTQYYLSEQYIVIGPQAHLAGGELDQIEFLLGHVRAVQY
jgi:hypothetical protein